MLGKAEYIKYVLRSVCEERIKYFLSNKVINEPQGIIQSLKISSSVEKFLDDFGWYQDFIDRIPVEYESLYRFAAFVSDNIGNLKKINLISKKKMGLQNHKQKHLFYKVN